MTIAPELPRVAASPRPRVIEDLNGLDRATAERIIEEADAAYEAWCDRHPRQAQRPAFYYRYHRTWRDAVRAGLRRRCLSLRQAVDTLRAVRVIAGW